MKKFILFLMLAVAGFAQRPAIWSPTVSSSQSAATVTIANDNATNATMYPTWVTTTSGNLPLYVSSTKINFNPSTGFLSLPLGGQSAKSYVAPLTTLTYAATTDIVMSSTLNTVSLTGNVTFTTSAKAAGQFVTVRVVCDGSNRTLTWPGTWVWVGSTAPATLLANKVGLLSLICFGTADSDVVASWASSL